MQHGYRWIAIGLVLTVGLVDGLVQRPIIGAAVVLAAAVFGLYVFRPTWLAGVTIFLAFATLPSYFPVVVPLIPFGVYPYQVSLVVTVVWLFLNRRARMPGSFRLFTAMLIVGGIAGLAQGHGEPATLRDVRNLVDMMLGAAAVVMAWPDARFRRAVIRASGFTLWFSALTTVLASAGSLSIIATVTEVGTNQTSRFQTSTNFFALAALCLVLSLWLTRRATSRDLLVFALPSIIVLLISFSRNSLIGVGVAVVVTVIGVRSISRVTHIASRLAALAVLGAFFLFAAPALPGGAFVQTQLEAFKQRVLDGISGSSLTDDGSAQFRVEEIRLITPAIKRSPFIGHAFGASYKPPIGPSDMFLSTQAPYYCHNFYYWLALKVGLIGVALFAWLTLRPILQCLRTGQRDAIAAAAVLSGLLAVSVVAPVPNGASSGLAFGLALGLTVAMARNRPRAVAPAPPTGASGGSRPVRTTGQATRARSVRGYAGPSPALRR